MSGLDELVRRVYGDRLRSKGPQGSAHHLYAHYVDQAGASYYLRSVELPAHLMISEAISERVARQYAGLLTPLQILPLQRNFQSATYLLKAPHKVILLSPFLQVKREYKEPMEPEFLARFLTFLLTAHQLLLQHRLPLFTMAQVGITEAEEFTLCDPSLYFKQEVVEKDALQFGPWVASLVEQLVNLPLNKELHDEAIKDLLGRNIQIMRPVIDHLLSAKATPDSTQAKMAVLLSRISEEVTTVNSSFADANDIDGKSHKSEGKPSQKLKINKVGRMLMGFVLLGALAVACYFCVQFFNRSIVCDQGYFLETSLNQCRSCVDGCLRCTNNNANTCSRCSLSMYLVLEEEGDKEGFCLKECRGKLINMNVCISNEKKKTAQHEGKIQVKQGRPPQPREEEGEQQVQEMEEVEEVGGGLQERGLSASSTY